MVFVTFSSLFSFEGMQMGSFSLHIPHMDKIVHFVFYSVMVFTGYFAIKDELKNRFLSKEILSGIVLFAIVYGIIIEVLQYVFTTNRHGDIWDVLANSLGAIIGSFAVRLLFYRKRSLK